jgi:hypothetical protein
METYNNSLPKQSLGMLWEPNINARAKKSIPNWKSEQIIFMDGEIPPNQFGSFPTSVSNTTKSPSGCFFDLYSSH